MTVSTTNTDFTARDHSGIWAPFVNFFAGISGGFRAYNTYTTLNRLSDRQLADLGMTRYDIPRAAADQILKG